MALTLWPALNGIVMRLSSEQKKKSEPKPSNKLAKIHIPTTGNVLFTCSLHCLSGLAQPLCTETHPHHRERFVHVQSTLPQWTSSAFVH